VSRYFGAFGSDVLRDFYDSFEQWELESVALDLAKANMFDQPSSSSRTLSDVPSAVVYRMVSNWTVFKDPRIQSIIHALPPVKPLLGWPTDPMPPGIFILLMHDNPKIREWAYSQTLKCDVVPMPNDQFVGSYIKAIEGIGRALTSTSTTQRPLVEDSALSFASDLNELWHGLFYVLRHTPIEAVKSNAQQNVDLRRIVIGHVHDTGPRKSYRS
jgi:senataxin